MNTIGTCGQPFRLKTSYCCFWLRLKFHNRDEHRRLTMGSTIAFGCYNSSEMGVRQKQTVGSSQIMNYKKLLKRS